MLTVFARDNNSAFVCPCEVPVKSSERFNKTFEFIQMIPPQYNHAYALFIEEMDGNDPDSHPVAQKLSARIRPPHRLLHHLNRRQEAAAAEITMAAPLVLTLAAAARGRISTVRGKS